MMTVVSFNLLQHEVYMLTKIVQYYRLDNTGFTNGTAWFDGDRYSTFDEVKEAYKERRWTETGDMVKWRIAEITITKIYADPCNTEIQTEEITQERYLYVNKDYT